MFIGVICGTMCSHAFARPLVVFFLSHPWSHVLNLFYFYFNDLSKTMLWVLYIVCVFTITCIQLPYLQCIPWGVHRVRMSSFCVKRYCVFSCVNTWACHPCFLHWHWGNTMYEHQWQYCPRCDTWNWLEEIKTTRACIHDTWDAL